MFKLNAMSNYPKHCSFFYNSVSSSTKSAGNLFYFNSRPNTLEFRMCNFCSAKILFLLFLIYTMRSVYNVQKFSTYFTYTTQQKNIIKIDEFIYFANVLRFYDK